MTAGFSSGEVRPTHPPAIIFKREKERTTNVDR